MRDYKYKQGTVTKEHLDKIMEEYKKLPDTDFCSQKVYEAMIDTLNDINDVSNGEVLTTLKMMVLQLCENMTTFTEEEEFRQIQEKYK